MKKRQQSIDEEYSLEAATVPPELGGTRLDGGAARLFDRHSRSQIQKWIASLTHLFFLILGLTGSIGVAAYGVVANVAIVATAIFSGEGAPFLAISR